MASIDRADPVILGHVLAEHRELFNLIVAARTSLSAAAPPSERQRAEVLACLGQLREHLRDHFAQEERGGFLEESVARVPRLSAQVQSIVAQHPVLLAELDGLIRELEAATDGAESWARAARAFADFSTHMTEHEKRENAVVQEGYNEDLGLVE